MDFLIVNLTDCQPSFYLDHPCSRACRHAFGRAYYPGGGEANWQRPSCPGRRSDSRPKASRELCALLPVLVSQPACKRRYPCSLDVSGAHAVHGSRPFHTGSSRASGWGRWTVDIEHGERERCLVDVKFMAARAPIYLRVVSRPIYEPWGGTLLRRPSGSWVRPPWP
jgi:hypothetical protein